MLGKERFRIAISNEGKLQFYNVPELQKRLLFNKNFDGYMQLHRLNNDNIIKTCFKIYRWWVDLISEEMCESSKKTDDILCDLFLSEEQWSDNLEKIVPIVRDKNDLSFNDWLKFLREIHYLCFTRLNFCDKKTGNCTLPIPNNLKGKL